jgi:chloride channel 7
MKVRDIYQVLSSNEHQHNGFPVVDPEHGKYLGMVLRSHILLLLKHKKFFDHNTNLVPLNNDLLSLNQIRSSYPRFFPIDNCDLSEDDFSKLIDLGPYLNQSVNVVRESSTLASIFRLFRALGLRHLAVIDSEMRPIGIVTRKDISRFRSDSEVVLRLPVDDFNIQSVNYE